MTADDDEGLKSLLRWAGRRPMPPDEVSSAVYQHSRSAWLAQVRRRHALRRGYAWAAGGAAFVMACWGAWNLYPHQVVATVAPGQAVIINHSLWHPLAGDTDGNLFEGDTLQTFGQGAQLQRADGTDLRVSDNASLSFPSPSTVRLRRGRLYVQTHGVARTRDLVVNTDLGSIEHLGTQFLVERDNDALLVAVRDGRVALHYPQHEAVELRDGQAARVVPHGELQRWDLEAFDSVWDWADGLAPPLAIDGQSLYAVLNQIAQRSGLVLRFSTPAAESAARSLALHGAPLELQPRDALAAVLATTTLSGTAADRVILVSAR
jgi:ferric-dicitrate binding protein FerR (iron transport regulator)